MKNYYYLENSLKMGPFSFEELKEKEIEEETLIWYKGLEDWIPAKNVEELESILELKPPPIPIEENKKIINEIKKTTKLKKGSAGWIIAGFVFSLLGGFLGIAIGGNYAFGKYHKETKTLGWVMIIIGIFSTAIWKNL